MPRRADWWVNKDGQAFHPEDEPQSETISFVDPNEFINSQSVFQQGQDFLSKLDKHSRTQAETELIKEETELIKEIKDDIRDERLRRKWGRL